jgi:hypothetical protein
MSKLNTKPFDCEPLVKAMQILNRFQARDVDREFTNAQRELNEEIKSIDQWHQSRREQLLQELSKIDEHHKQMVNEYTTKWNARVEELNFQRYAIDRQTNGHFQNFYPTRHDEYLDELEIYNETPRFEIGDWFDHLCPSNRMTLNPVFYHPLNAETNEQFLENTNPSEEEQKYEYNQDTMIICG